MIKLDWDNISFSPMYERLEEIKKYQAFEEIRVFSSPSLDGFHIEIDSFYRVPQEVNFNYRYVLKDDLNRLVKDMLFFKNSGNLETRDILHDFKEKTKNGTTKRFHRKLLFIYHRSDNNDEWQLMKTEKNSPTYTQKVSQRSAQLSLS